MKGIVYKNEKTGQVLVFTLKAAKRGAIKVPPGFKKISNEKE